MSDKLPAKKLAGLLGLKSRAPSVIGETSSYSAARELMAIPQPKQSIVVLSRALADARAAYAMYEGSASTAKKMLEEKQLDEKTFNGCKDLFAKDFADFKLKLNIAIRTYNQFMTNKNTNKWTLDEEQKGEFATITQILEHLKKLYNADKALYVPASHAPAEPTIASGTNSSSSSSPAKSAPSISGPRLA